MEAVLAILTPCRQQTGTQRVEPPDCATLSSSPYPRTSCRTASSLGAVERPRTTTWPRPGPQPPVCGRVPGGRGSAGAAESRGLQLQLLGRQGRGRGPWGPYTGLEWQLGRKEGGAGRGAGAWYTRDTGTGESATRGGLVEARMLCGGNRLGQTHARRKLLQKLKKSAMSTSR